MRPDEIRKIDSETQGHALLIARSGRGSCCARTASSTVDPQGRRGMNDDDEFLDQFEPDRRPDTGEQLAFGEVMYPWRTPYPYDGPQAPAPAAPNSSATSKKPGGPTSPRGPSGRSPRSASRWFPSCWLRHPALVEEAQALWLLVRGMDAGHRTGRTSAVPPQPQPRPQPDRDALADPVPPRLPQRTDPERETVRVRPLTRDWWSLEEFDPTATAW